MDQTRTAWYSGRVGKYDLRLRVYTIENNVGGNYSRYHWDLYAYSHVGWGTYVLDSRPWAVSVAGHYWSGSRGLDFRPDYAGKTIYIAGGDTGPVYHDGAGNLNFTMGANHVNVGVLGTADIGTHWVSGDFLPKRPQAPTMIGLDEITTTSARVRFSGNYDGGTPVREWAVEYGSDPTFVTKTRIASSGTSTLSPLVPASAIHARAQGRNDVGWSDWSAIASGTTLPSTPPGISVAPSLNGTSAIVTLTPPGGVSGVTEYNIERRPSGGAAVATTSTTVSKTITGLNPGTGYEWRANAEIGNYTSPWSAWGAYVQPNPNTNPGDYFDTTTPARPDRTFVAAGGGTTHAYGQIPLGWNCNHVTPGSAGDISRVTGGLFGGYAARVHETRDATGPGVEAGASTVIAQMPAIEENTVYTSSMYVKPLGRSQRMAMVVRHYNEAGTNIDGWMGTSTLCPADVWTRLSVTLRSPAGATRLHPRVIDRAGTGHSPWLSGDQWLLDGIMVTLGDILYPYFDGDTPTDNLFEYNWEGAAHSSVSARTDLPPSLAANPLADPEDTPVPTAPLPPEIPSDDIDEVGAWRRYMVPVPAEEVPLWGATLPTLVLSTEVEPERQVRIRYFPNPLNVAAELVDFSVWEAELILTYIPPDTEITLDGVTQRVWASVNGGDPLAGDELLYGTGGLPATWPELTCGVGYVITLDVPLDAPAGNLKTRLLLTQRV